MAYATPAPPEAAATPAAAAKDSANKRQAYQDSCKWAMKEYLRERNAAEESDKTQSRGSVKIRAEVGTTATTHHLATSPPTTCHPPPTFST